MMYFPLELLTPDNNLMKVQIIQDLVQKYKQAPEEPGSDSRN